MQLNNATSFLCADVMKTTRILTAILIMGACCSRVYAQDAPDKPTADPKALSEALTINRGDRVIDTVSFQE